MKLFIFLSAVFCTITSCSHEELLEEEIPITSVSSREIQLPYNSANAYDSIGQLHNELSEAFIEAGDTASSTFNIIATAEAIGTQNARFNRIKPLDYTTPQVEEIEKLLSHNTTFLSVVDSTSLSYDAKISLSGFVDQLMLYNVANADYETVIFPYIIGYESDIISSLSHTPTDMKIILTTTSIARHALYLRKKIKKKRIDRDWYISIGNIAAGTQGSIESGAKAAMMATVAGISFNQ